MAQKAVPEPRLVFEPPEDGFFRENPSRRRLTYDELDAIVQRYKQTKDPQAAQDLIDAFEGYLMHYYVLLTRGVFGMHRPDLRRFLAVFVVHRYHEALGKDTTIKKTGARYALLKTAAMLKDQLMSAYTPDELWHELTSVLLEMALRYESNDQAPRFHTYVAKAYCIHAAAAIRKRLNSDPLVFHRNSLRTLVVERAGDREVLRDVLLTHPAPTYPSEKARQVVDEAWVAGIGTHPVLSDLTPLEREVLAAYYLDREKVRQTAARLGLSIAETSRIRREAEVKVRAKGWRRYGVRPQTESQCRGRRQLKGGQGAGHHAPPAS